MEEHKWVEVLFTVLVLAGMIAWGYFILRGEMV